MKFLVMPAKRKDSFKIHSESCAGIYCDGLRIGGCPVRLGCYLM